MKRFCAGVSFGVLLIVGCSGEEAPHATATASLPACQPAQLAGVRPTYEEVQRHRRFDFSTPTYAANEYPKTWGYRLLLRVDAEGRIVCHETTDDFGTPIATTPQRQALLADIAQRRYAPFSREGKRVPAIVREEVWEERASSVRRPLPEAPLDSFRIMLSRSGCFGWCPIYSVEIHGDGRVVYTGEGHVDVEGRHEYRIPVDDVRALLDQVRQEDLWSTDTEYMAGITDNPTYCLSIELGGQRHVITDYVGRMVGMPRAVQRVEDAVDKVSRAREWTELSAFSMEHLQQAGFDFRSQAGADLLVRAIGNRKGFDEHAMLRAIELGSPLRGGQTALRPTPEHALDEMEVFESALRLGRVALVEPLMAKGVLREGGRLDRGKLDRAFRAAIQGGRLASVRAIWNASDSIRPSLMYQDEDDDDARRIVATSVVMLLDKSYGDDEWEGLAIAKWLADKGAPLDARAANGDSLLHIAVEASNIAFARFVLAQGLDPSTKGEYDLPALGGAQDEDVALLLLASGSDWHMDDQGKGFLRYARDQRWTRVLELLKQPLEEGSAKR